MDPQQQQAAHALAGLGFGLVATVLFIGLALLVFFIYLFWRILKKAGMSPLLALLAIPIIPFGPVIVMCIIAFGEWKVVPVTPGYSAGLQPYPPAYPPTTYPPAGPPAQL